jgi:hypothetical protein
MNSDYRNQKFELDFTTQAHHTRPEIGKRIAFSPISLAIVDERVRRMFLRYVVFVGHTVVSVQ